MKKLNVLSLVKGSGRDRAADIDDFCDHFCILSYWPAVGAKTLPVGLFCTGWSYGGTYL